MASPFITIVHNTNNNYCKLLLVYDENKFYYSENKSHRELIYFKQPSLVEIYKDTLVIHSKNNKRILIIHI